MNDTINLSRKLNQTIKNSDEYRRYIETRDRLLERQDLLNSLKEFRQKNYRIQNSDEYDNPYDEVTNLFAEYDDLLHNTIVNEFIRADQKLCRMMRTVYEELADGLEFGLGE